MNTDVPERRARIGSCDSALHEVLAAACLELAKPIRERNHDVLLFLELQRQKYVALAQALSDDGTSPGDNRDSDSAIGSHVQPSTPILVGFCKKPIRIVSIGGIGDAILLTPVLRALAKLNPQRRIIVWAGNPAHESVFKHNPYVAKLRRVGRTFEKVYRALAGHKFLPYVDSTYASFIPTVVYAKHATAILAEKLGVSLQNETPELYLTEPELAKAARTLRSLKRPLVAIHLTAACSANKNWATENWKALVSRNRDCTFVQIGGRDEPIVNGAVNLIGAHLRDAFAILKQCDAFVGVESGFAHAAAALQTPGVVLFGPSTPSVWGHPNNINMYSRRYCSPCLDLIKEARCPFSNACMNELSVPMVEHSLSLITAVRLAR